MEPPILYGAYTPILEVLVTNGEQTAEITYTLPLSQPLNQADIPGYLESALEGARESLGEGWRLCTPNEFVSHKLGGRVHTNLEWTPSV